VDPLCANSDLMLARADAGQHLLVVRYVTDCAARGRMEIASLSRSTAPSWCPRPSGSATAACAR